MKILYFARIRQVVGRSSEEIEVPSSVVTVSGLLDYLAARDDGFAAAFADRRTIRAASIRFTPAWMHRSPARARWRSFRR